MRGLIAAILLFFALGCSLVNWDRAREHYLAENPDLPEWRAELVRQHEDWKTGITVKEWILIHEFQPNLIIDGSDGQQTWLAETTKGDLYLFVDAKGKAIGDGVILSWSRHGAVR